MVSVAPLGINGPGGNAFYEGLQVSARKEFSQGFLMTFAYTYSKAEMTGYGRNEGDGINSNPIRMRTTAPRKRVGSVLTLPMLSP